MPCNERVAAAQENVTFHNTQNTKLKEITRLHKNNFYGC